MTQLPAQLGALKPEDRADLLRSPLDPVTNGSRLIPIAAAQTAIQAVEQELASEPELNSVYALAGKLVGMYPNQAHDVDSYGEGLAETLRRYPYSLGEEAIREVSEESRFIPTRADVKAKLDELVERRRGMIRRAKAHLAEHDRRARAASETRLTLDQLPADLRAEVEDLAGFASKGVRK